jgi:hypothetical protein
MAIHPLDQVLRRVAALPNTTIDSPGLDRCHGRTGTRRAGRAFLVAPLETALNLLSVTSCDPFSDITNQDMLQAFDEVAACEEIVSVL